MKKMLSAIRLFFASLAQAWTLWRNERKHTDPASLWWWCKEMVRFNFAGRGE
jgi:hypothetical protein